MVKAGLSTDPLDRMGVYKQLSEVPQRYRLTQYEATYQSRDVWSEWVVERDIEENGLSDYLKDRLPIVARSWEEHMNTRDRHHALSTPKDVETWIVNFVDGSWKMRTVYENYWVHLERFYRWLRFHTDHPHVYDPVLMAAANHPASKQVWEFKIQSGRNFDDNKG